MKIQVRPAKDMCKIALRGYKLPSTTPAKIETLKTIFKYDFKFYCCNQLIGILFVDYRFEGNRKILQRITDVMSECY